MGKTHLTDEQASKLIHQINSLDDSLDEEIPHEEIPLWFEAIVQEHIAAKRAMLGSFEVPRKVYLHTSEWMYVSGLWRAFILSAGESGKDEHGKYQVFSLSKKE